MCDKRSAAFVFVSFVAGLICTAWVHGPTLLDPVPEPFFGLDLDTVAPPVSAPRPAAEQRPPERLAFGPTVAPIAARIEAQALPTSGDDQPGGVEQAAPTSIPSESGAVPPAEFRPAHGVDGDAAGATAPEAARRVVPTEALKALGDRARQARAAGPTPAPTPAEPVPAEPVPAATAKPPPPPDHGALPAAAPLVDPPAAADDVGRGESPAPRSVGRRFGLLLDRRADPQPERGGDEKHERPLFGGRLLERVRSEAGLGNAARGSGVSPDRPAAPETPGGRWPQPVRLFEQLDQLERLARSGGEPAAAVAGWASDAARSLRVVTDTVDSGTCTPESFAQLLAASHAGMTAAEAAPTLELATLARRSAIAVGRRAATWQAAAGVCGELLAAVAHPGTDVGPSLEAGQKVVEVVGLLQALERYEMTQAAADARAVQAVLRPLTVVPLRAAPALVQAVTDHYLAPNVRVAIHRDFITRVLPEKTVTSGRMEDFVLGRAVRGTNTVEQSLGVGFVPSRSEIRCELQVSGAVSSRTVTDGGIADIHSQGTANFVVRKPVSVSARGLAFGTALGSASNSARLAGIDTPFNGVPIMGGMMHKAVVSRYEESRDEAAREVNDKIIVRACRQVDKEAEPKLREMAERLRERIWMPMVELGLEPTPVQLETTEAVATVRLRLAAAGQLAAHTPRSRVPEAAILSLQVHESTLNNGSDRLELAGRRMSVEELLRTVCVRLGLTPHLPPDLPEGVEVAFAAVEPLRVECRDGLVRLRLTLDTLQSGRRAWHDIVAHVAYRPVSAGMQVRLERDGKVKLSGPGQRGQLEIALRTIFGKIFPAERPIDLLPASLVGNPRLADLEAIQAAATDGWFSLGLAPRVESPAVAPQPPAPPRRQAIGLPRPRRR